MVQEFLRINSIILEPVCKDTVIYHCMLFPHSAKMNKYAAVVVNVFAGEIQANGVGQE